VQKFEARAVILGGAGLAGIAAVLQPELDVPLIDSVRAGARWALLAPAPASDRATPGFDVRWGHVSPELEALGR
jgi:hypothetical protein